jgi:hypothetical protein
MRVRILLLVLGSCLFAADRVPMEANYQDSASYRWLDKQVLDRRLLEDMHSLDMWSGLPLLRGASHRSPWWMHRGAKPHSRH